MSEEIRKLARKVITGSIVAQATERLVIQIVEVCSEHEKEKVEVMRATCEAIAREHSFEGDASAVGIGSVAAKEIVDAIAALKGKVEP